MAQSPWFHLANNAPVDFNRHTTDAVVRAAQRALGVAADGTVGDETKNAFARRVSETFNAMARADDPNTVQARAALRAIANEIGSVRDGQPLPRNAWAMLAPIGLVQMGLAGAEGAVVTGGAPLYRAPRAVRQPPAPNPPGGTPGGVGGQGGSQIQTLSQGASSLAALSNFYKGNKTLVWISGSLLLVAGAAVLLLPEMKSSTSSSSVREQDARRAADTLGISIESDAQSIRAAAARALKAYQDYGPGDREKSEILTSARDVLLRWQAEKSRAASAQTRSGA